VPDVVSCAADFERLMSPLDVADIAIGRKSTRTGNDA